MSSDFLAENVTYSGVLKQTSVAAKGTILASDVSNDFVSLTIGTDNNVLIADSSASSGISWGILGGTAGIATVGPPDADFANVKAAVDAGHKYICIINDLTEPVPVVFSGSLLLCIGPGVTYDNASTGDWFQGAGPLYVRGSGTSSTTGVGSTIILAIVGVTDAFSSATYLITENVRFESNGLHRINESGTAQINTCVFGDFGATASSYEFSSAPTITNCIFESPSTFTSCCTISNCTFKAAADIELTDGNDVIFEGNLLGETGASGECDMLISGTTTTTSITGNIFKHGELTIEGTLNTSNISNNSWFDQTTDGITIDTNVNTTVISGNTLHHITITTSTATETNIIGNTLVSSINLTGGDLIDSNIIGNRCQSVLITGDVTGSNIGQNQFSTSVDALNISGNISRTILSDNTADDDGGGGTNANFIIGGTASLSSVCNNRVGGDLEINGLTIDSCFIIGNLVNQRKILFTTGPAVITKTSICDNFAGDEIAIGVSSDCVICGNFCAHNDAASMSVTSLIRSNFSNNNVDESLTIGSSNNSTIVGNVVHSSSITFTTTVRRSCISANKSNGLIFSGDVETSTVSANRGGAITFSANIATTNVNGNYCTSLTASTSSGSSLVTSNIHGATFTGFGGDTTANNIA